MGVFAIVEVGDDHSGYVKSGGEDDCFADCHCVWKCNTRVPPMMKRQYIYVNTKWPAFPGPREKMTSNLKPFTGSTGAQNSETKL
jgi:hypothetical protein